MLYTIDIPPHYLYGNYPNRESPLRCVCVCVISAHTLLYCVTSALVTINSITSFHLTHVSVRNSTRKTHANIHDIVFNVHVSAYFVRCIRDILALFFCDNSYDCLVYYNYIHNIDISCTATHVCYTEMFFSKRYTTQFSLVQINASRYYLVAWCWNTQNYLPFLLYFFVLSCCCSRSVPGYFPPPSAVATVSFLFPTNPLCNETLLSI